MLVILKQNFDQVSCEAARIVAAAVRHKPSLVLGLATGGSTLGMYAELVRMHREEGLDFSRVVTFNLDEYIGLSADHPQSLHFFMQRNFFMHVNVTPENRHIPSAVLTEDYDDYCAAFEESLRRAGGIDLQILGIGRNGHIGFNEPTSSLGSRTRLKVLSRETLEDNRKSFASENDMPKCGITMGIGTILEARKIIVLAAGASKAGPVAKAIEGPVSAAIPASALQLHPEVTFYVDEQAAARLSQKDYYRRVMEMTALLTPARLS